MGSVPTRFPFTGLSDQEVVAAMPVGERAKLSRLGMIERSAERAGKAAEAAAEWARYRLAMAAMDTQTGDDFSAALASARAIAATVAADLWGGMPADRIVTMQRLLASPDRLLALADKLQNLAMRIFAAAMAVPVLMVAAPRSEAAGAPARGVAAAPELHMPFQASGSAVQFRLNDAGLAAVADARWMTTQATMIAAADMDKRQANATRVQRSRARKREGIRTATVHFHDNDLMVLREMGLLTGSTQAEVGAALDGLLQAALAVAGEGERPRSQSERFMAWADRLAALRRVAGSP